jgi:phosphoribosyl-ATP pyrophosphohydrolase/phosphoribosyl-AMP cyclohydrolase
MLEGGILADCDHDALLVRVRPLGPVCHTGADTCWQEANTFPDFLHELEAVIERRSQDSPEDSYTARLLQRGINKVAQKVGEEAVETVIEALGDNRELLLEESADLMYHFLVLLKAKGVRLSEVEAVLKGRHK